MSRSSWHLDEKTAPRTLIGDLKPLSKKLNVKCIILEVKGKVTTKQGKHIVTVLAADESGSVDLPLWGEHGSAIRAGDIVVLKNGYCSLFKGKLTLNVGNSGRIWRVGRFTMLYSEVPRMSEMAF
jgi:ssDNA-binding replication factor A large subunit